MSTLIRTFQTPINAKNSGQTNIQYISKPILFPQWDRFKNPEEDHQQQGYMLKVQLAKMFQMKKRKHDL